MYYITYDQSIFNKAKHKRRIFPHERRIVN